MPLFTASLVQRQSDLDEESLEGSTSGFQHMGEVVAHGVGNQRSQGLCDSLGKRPKGVGDAGE